MAGLREVVADLLMKGVIVLVRNGKVRTIERDPWAVILSVRARWQDVVEVKDGHLVAETAPAGPEVANHVPPLVGALRVRRLILGKVNQRAGRRGSCVSGCVGRGAAPGQNQKKGGQRTKT